VTSLAVTGLQHRALCEVIAGCGEAVLALVADMQGEDELFASRNTLARIEAQLLTMAQTLGSLPPALQLALPLVDWSGWRAVHRCLAGDRRPRRGEIWYAISALVPATLVLLDRLRQRRPWLFRLA
jgi:hypothetical protein